MIVLSSSEDMEGKTLSDEMKLLSDGIELPLDGTEMLSNGMERNYRRMKQNFHRTDIRLKSNEKTNRCPTELRRKSDGHLMKLRRKSDRRQL